MRCLAALVWLPVGASQQVPKELLRVPVAKWPLRHENAPPKPDPRAVCPPRAKGDVNVFSVAAGDAPLGDGWPEWFRFHAVDDAAMRRSAAGLGALLAGAGARGFAGALARLRPRAFRAELWRYAALWACGGWFVDARLRLAGSVDDLVVASRARGGWHKMLHVVTDADGSLWPGFLAAPKPGHPALLRAVAAVVDNVRAARNFSDRPGDRFRYVAGSGVLSAAVVSDADMDERAPAQRVPRVRRRRRARRRAPLRRASLRPRRGGRRRALRRRARLLREPVRVRRRSRVFRARASPWR